MYEVLVGARVMHQIRELDGLIEIAAGSKPYPWEAAPNPDFDNSNVRDLIRDCLRRDPTLRPSAAMLREAVDRMGMRQGSAAARPSTPAASLAARSASGTDIMLASTAIAPTEMATLNR